MDRNLIQDHHFTAGEGDAWFARNRSALLASDKVDWPLLTLDRLPNTFHPRSILELGCANGWRLDRLQRRHECKASGVDASSAAIADGKERFPNLELRTGVLSEPPLDEVFDLVIVSFVLHWVDRRSLAASIAGIDRTVADGGLLLLADFLPDTQRRRRYHHRTDAELYTYKQDYAQAFEALGIYRTVLQLTFDHDARPPVGGPCPGDRRGCCAVLQKSLADYYPIES